MQISMIRNKDGEGKQLMSQFPMKGIKPKWLRVSAGCENKAEWEIHVHKL